MPSLFVEVIEGTAKSGGGRHVVRKLPDGSLGLLCQGMIYPLQNDYQIQLEGPSFYPQDCQPIVSLEAVRPPSTTVINQPAQIIEGPTSNWVVFPGDDLLLNGVVYLAREECDWTVLSHGLVTDPLKDLLSSVAEIAVESGDESLLFIQLSPNSPCSEIEIGNLLHEARRGWGAYEPSSVSAADLYPALATKDLELSLVSESFRELQESHRSEILHLSSHVDLLKAAVSQYRRDLAEAEKARQEVLSATARVAEHAQSSSQQNQPEAAAQLQQDLEEALQNWQRAETDLANARVEIEERENRLADYKNEMQSRSKITDSISLSAGRRKVRERDVASLLKCAFPSIEFDIDSITYVAAKVTNLNPLITQLRQMYDLDRDALQSKKLKGVDGWFETHFSTGHGDEGRLYFSWISGNSSKKARVLVSEKTRQEQDIAKLR